MILYISHKEIQNINARQLFKININIKYFGVRDREVFEGEVIRDDFNQNRLHTYAKFSSLKGKQIDIDTKICLINLLIN